LLGISRRHPIKLSLITAVAILAAAPVAGAVYTRSTSTTQTTVVTKNPKESY
jgi:hypothetical protein